MFRPALFALALAVTVCSSAARADPISFSDNFEAPTINPFWQLSTNSGSATLSNSPVHDGNQAIQFNTFATTSPLGMFVVLSHTFAAPVFGRVSVWALDTGADRISSNIIALSLQNSLTNQLGDILAPDYDLGPGQDGSLYAVATTSETSGVDRTQGWHLFAIDTTPTSQKYFIDGSLVFSSPVGLAFNKLQIQLSAPSFRPPWTTSFDQFSFVEFQPAAVPEPMSLAVFGGLAAVGWGVARRRRTA